jgi:hypothetical protein
MFAGHKKTAVGGAVDLCQQNWRFGWRFAESVHESIINYVFGFAQWFTQQFIVDNAVSFGVYANHRSSANTLVALANDSSAGAKARPAGGLRDLESISARCRQGLIDIVYVFFKKMKNCCFMSWVLRYYV